MAGPTIYHWTDAGGPERNQTPSNTHWTILRELLLACLVNGYTGKPAAGWTLVQDQFDLRGFSLQNASKTGIVNFVMRDTSWIDIYLCEAVTDVSAAVVVGENLRSGLWTPGSSSQKHTLYVASLSATPTTIATNEWVIVADGDTFSITFDPSSASWSSYNGYTYSLYVGRYINSNGFTGPTEFIALGSTLNSGSMSPYFQGYTVLRHPLTGIVLPSAGIELAGEPFKTNTLINDAAPWAGTVPDTISLVQAGVSYGSDTQTNGMCGRLRGIAYDPVLIEKALLYSARTVGVASLAAADKGRASAARPLGGYSVSLNGAAGSPRFFTTDPTFW